MREQSWGSGEQGDKAWVIKGLASLGGVVSEWAGSSPWGVLSCGVMKSDLGFGRTTLAALCWNRNWELGGFVLIQVKDEGGSAMMVPEEVVRVNQILDMFGFFFPGYVLKVELTWFLARLMWAVKGREKSRKLQISQPEPMEGWSCHLGLAFSSRMFRTPSSSIS